MKRAMWIYLAAGMWLVGCAPSRLPDAYRSALTVTARESARDLRAARATSRPEAALAPILTGYQASQRVVCAVLADDAAQGRGALEWLVGLAGITSGPSGEMDDTTRRACAEGR